MAKLNYSSLQSQMILQNHSMLIWCSINIYYYYQCVKKAVLLNCFVETMIHLRFFSSILIHNRNIFVTMYIFYCQFQSINFYIEIKVIQIIFLNSSIRSKISIELECLQKVFHILDMYTVQLVICFSNAFSQREGHEVFIIRIIGGIIFLSNLQWDHHLQKVNPPKFLHFHHWHALYVSNEDEMPQESGWDKCVLESYLIQFNLPRNHGRWWAVQPIPLTSNVTHHL